jgi:formylglycine-generating enzyme
LPDPRRHWFAGIAGISLAIASALAPHAFELPGARSGLALESLTKTSEPEHVPRQWRTIDKTQWQLVAAEGEGVADGAEDPLERANCPEGMVEARGKMKRDGARGTVEDLQTLACSEWTDHPEPRSCSAFDRGKWATLSRDLPTRPMQFCIDRLEYPNRAGEYPVIMVNWREAGAHCSEQGKRLCTEDEWTFACEGEEARPYSTGFTRDRHACVIDRPWRVVDFEVFASRTGPRILRELDDLWQGEPTGSHPLCRSTFGAFDMTGNVDEWTVTARAEGNRSILKGGYWGPIHARCRTSTRVHNEDFYFYQIGFRCCASPSEPLPGAGPPAYGGE